MPLNAKKYSQNLKKKYQKFIWAFFINQDGNKCLHNLNSGVLKCNVYFVSKDGKNG